MSSQRRAMMSRSFPIPLRRLALLTLLACMLSARVAVPAGWMPVAGAHGVVLAPCSGMGAAKVMAHAMPGMAMHHTDRPDRHPDPAGDHPCAGAGLSVAIVLPALDLPRALVVRPAVSAAIRPIASIGVGLAAPPPPQTGPPSVL